MQSILRLTQGALRPELFAPGSNAGVTRIRTRPTNLNQTRLHAPQGNLKQGYGPRSARTKSNAPVGNVSDRGRRKQEGSQPGTTVAFIASTI